MNETNLIIQNRLREATVSLERANLIICDETWKCDSSVPPFSSIQLVLQGEGTICIDETTIHPTSGQLYLLPAYTNQAFFTDIHNPYRTYYCHFEITCQQTDLFELIHLPLCIDAKDPKKAEQLFLDLVHSVRQDDIFSALKAKQAVLNLLCYYLECCPPDSVSLVAQTFDSPLSDAIAYVETHLNEQITVQQMAEAAGYHGQPLYAAVPVPHGHFSRSVHPSEKNGNRNAAFDLHRSAHRFHRRFSRIRQPVLFFEFLQKQTGMTPSSYRRLYLRAYLES